MGPLAPRRFRRATQNRSVCCSCDRTPTMPTIPLTHLLAIALAFPLATIASTASADCIDDAAAHHRVNALVLRAIGWHESRLQPAALGRNANGSVDVGAFQINSIHLAELARYGIDRAALADGCIGAEVAAWHYRRQVEQLGDGWQAVGAYHSRTNARAAWYANQVAAILMRWKAMPPGALPFPGDRAIAPGQPAALPPAAAPVPAARGELASTAHRDARGTDGFGVIAYLPPAR